MKKNGFTLAELMGALIIMGIIALIVFPTVNKSTKISKEKTYEEQKNVIIKGARKWGIENTDYLSETTDTYVSVEMLKQNGYIENKKVINPLTEEEMNGCIIISYDKASNQYLYNYNDTSCEGLENIPLITLSGDKEIIIGIGEEYIEEGVRATYKGTNITSSVVTTHNINNSEVGTYTVKYNVTYDGKSAKEVTRTVKVIDKSPTIALKGNNNIIIGQDEIYTDPGATARTYDGKDISNNITITNDVDTTTLGMYTVTYNVTYAGKTAKPVTRTVKVVDDSPTITINPTETSKYETRVIINVTSKSYYTENVISSLVYKVDGGSEQKIQNNMIILDTDGDHTLEITATDNKGNSKTITSGPYNIDTIAPMITFDEGDTAGISIDGSSLEDDDLKIGVNVSDNHGITLDNVTTSGNVSLIEGDYVVTYTATDEAGNTTTKNRNIKVYCPTITLMNKDVKTCSTRTKDSDKNLRFVGPNPNNYVKIGDQLWRIIGIFDGQAKIITNNSYATKTRWDRVYNDWKRSDLQDTLNTSFFKTIDVASKNNIDVHHTWSLGAASSASLTREEFYSDERGTDVFNGNPTTWTGAIGLMYPSDYGYSTSGRTSVCDIALDNWDTYTECYSNSWLRKSDYSQWTMTSYRGSDVSALLISKDIFMRPVYDEYYSATPVAYLKSEVTIVDGTGTSTDPFILSSIQNIVNDILAKSSSRQLFTEDPIGNLRYVGKSPNNYVEFNGELWRIIGVFDGHAKIIKNGFYNTEIAWDTNNITDWSRATLQQELNGAYLETIQTNDPTSYSYIDLTHVWNLGSSSEYIDEWERYKLYRAERGTPSHEGNPATWTGAIGLMYPSDYGYSTDFIINCDKTMNGWSSNCYSYSWLRNSSYSQWTLTTEGQSMVHVVSKSGGLGASLGGTDAEFAVKPVLYLKNNVRIVDGTGTDQDPFKLSQ